MGFEMPTDVDYFNHPKTLKLKAILGRRHQEADIYPLRLWAWAAKYAKSGVIPTGSVTIEAACGWRGVPGRLHAALLAATFLTPDGLAIHDWMAGIGRAILLYDRKKQKQREKYDREKGILPEECGKTSGSIPATLDTLDERGNSGGDTTASSPMGMLLKKAAAAHVAANPGTLRRYLEAWQTRSDYTKVEQILTDPWTRGKTVIEIQDHFFKINGAEISKALFEQRRDADGPRKL